MHERVCFYLKIALLKVDIFNHEYLRQTSRAIKNFQRQLQSTLCASTLLCGAPLFHVNSQAYTSCFIACVETFSIFRNDRFLCTRPNGQC